MKMKFMEIEATTEDLRVNKTLSEILSDLGRKLADILNDPSAVNDNEVEGDE